MRRNGLVWMAAAVVILPAASQAERHVYPLAEARVILSPRSAGRVLLDFASMEDLQHVVVTSAFLEVPLPSAVRNEDLEVCVYALSRGWRGQEATWTAPWSRPGGDLDETYFEEVTIPAGQSAGRLRLNVTQVVEEIVTAGTSSHGFVLTVPLRSREGFTIAERGLLGTMAGARLVVTTANARAAGEVGRRGG